MRSPIELMLARARVLSSPTRLNLWFSLGEDGMRPSELARIFGLAPSTVTHHMHALKRENLVELVGTGAHRVYRWSGVELVLASREELQAAARAEAELARNDDRNASRSAVDVPSQGSVGRN